MLAHFENFNLPALLKHLNMSHVLLFDLLYGDTLSSLLVHSKLDETELALAKRLVELIELEDVDVAHCLLQAIHPQLLFLFLWEEDQARFIRRDNKFYRMEIFCFLGLLLASVIGFARLRRTLG